MLNRFRRSRFLALLLAVASPAALGTLVPVLDPCPVDMPWLATGPESHTHAGHHGAGTGSAPGASHPICHCVNGCVAGAATAPPPPAAWRFLSLGLPVQVRVTSPDASLELAPRSALLPFATAPPLL